MKIEKREDGNGMVLTNGNGESLNVSFMEFWEICKAGDRMDTRAEVENYLGECSEIAGHEPDKVLDKTELIDSIVEEVISKRIENENGDQIWEAAEKKIKEFYEQKVTLIVHDYGEDEEQPIRSTEFTVGYSSLENYLDVSDYRTVEEFIKDYDNDDIKIFYNYMKIQGKIFSENAIECEQIEKQAKVEMTHNEYQEYLQKNANRLYSDPDYTMMDYDRDAESVIITGFELDKFSLSDEKKEFINKRFQSEKLSRMGNLCLECSALTASPYSGVFPIAKALECENVRDEGLRGFFKNDEERLVLEFCEGDIYLVLCETDLDYKKELDSYCEFYGVKSVSFEVKVFNEETFDYDKARIGDIVTQKVVNIAMDSLPPVSKLSDCSQPGGAWSMREEPGTGKLKDTYATFKRLTSGENGLWKFCGDCFAGENEVRGKKPEWIEGKSDEKEVKQDLGSKILDAHGRCVKKGINKDSEKER